MAHSGAALEVAKLNEAMATHKMHVEMEVHMGLLSGNGNRKLSSQFRCTSQFEVMRSETVSAQFAEKSNRTLAGKRNACFPV